MTTKVEKPEEKLVYARLALDLHGRILARAIELGLSVNDLIRLILINYADAEIIISERVVNQVVKGEELELEVQQQHPMFKRK